MICSKCNRDFPSKYHFVGHSICIECFEKMPAKDKDKILKEVESRFHEGAAKRIIHDKTLICPVCGHEEFWKRKTLMNTPGLTFMGVEWANKQAENLICDACGYIYWFFCE